MSESNNTKVVNLIHFHGITLWVINHESTDYIYAKPLVDLAGIDWRSAKKTLFDDDNAILYGTQRLKHPKIAAEGGEHTPTSEGVYIRLDRARIYLARIHTNRMKAQGRVEAAERLLALQIEWAKAIHQYETYGVAYKKAEKDRAQLINLFKVRNAATGQGEREAVTRMIHDTFIDLGYPVVDPQQELPLH